MTKTRITGSGLGKPDPGATRNSGQINPKFLDPGGPRSDDDEDYKGEWREAVEETKHPIGKPDPNSAAGIGAINPKFLDPAGPRAKAQSVAARGKRLK